ncbi:hypothetical protein OK016_22390 [Vibrio chagasii]|nr:hypothetical protein [Vibrio chagasii]
MVNFLMGGRNDIAMVFSAGEERLLLIKLILSIKKPKWGTVGVNRVEQLFHW